MATGTQPTGTCEESKVNAWMHVDWLQGQVPRLVSNLMLSLLPLEHLSLLPLGRLTLSLGRLSLPLGRFSLLPLG